LSLYNGASSGAGGVLFATLFATVFFFAVVFFVTAALFFTLFVFFVRAIFGPLVLVVEIL
jgi:hypothetical protein